MEMRAPPCSSSTSTTADDAQPILALVTSALSSSAAADDEKTRKRLKHREYVKKSYQKKITTIHTLKSQLSALETQYDALLVSRTGNGNSTTFNTTTTADPPTPPPPRRLLHQYVQLSRVKSQYQAQNAQLYEHSAAFMKAESRVQQLLDGETNTNTSPYDQPPHQQQPHRQRFQIQSLPESDYATIIACAKDDILQFANDANKLSTGSSVFGWTDQRKINGDELKFALEKPFPQFSASELLAKSWPLFTNPETFCKIYNAAFNIQFHKLQEINEDTLLLYRTVQVAGTQVVAKTVFLLARIQIQDGYMILFRSIDKDRVQFQEETKSAGQDPVSEVWVDKYSWVVFYEKQSPLGGGCLFHFGGSTLTNLWLKEVLFIALKWETMVVGPPLALEL